MPVTYVRNENGQFEQVGPGGATTDTTLSQPGKPADAAAVGSALSGYATEAYVSSQVNTKVDQVNGKGLSTNDYTSAEKTKLAGIATGANKTVVDSALSSTSTNPVQNKVVDAALKTKSDTTHTHSLADFGFQYGKVAVSCTANTVSTANVTFDREYKTMPIVTVTAGSSSPGTIVQEVTVSNITYTGFTVCVYRTNTSTTTIQWMAAGTPK